MSELNELLTLEEICTELRGEVSIGTLRRRIKDGGLRATKLGRKFLVRRVWLDEMIDRGSKWQGEDSTNTNSETSGLVNGQGVRRGTSCGPTGNRAALSDFQRAQTILTKPNEN